MLTWLARMPRGCASRDARVPGRIHLGAVLSTRPSVLFILALLVTLLCAVPTVVADGPSRDLKMEAVPGFGGYVKRGEWLPIWLELENNGPDLQAEAHVSVSHSDGTVTYAVPLSLAPGSRTRTPVYVLPDNLTRVLEVRLVDSQGTTLLSQTVQVTPLANVHYVVGLIATERGALSLVAGASIEGLSRSMVPVDVPVPELPERPEGLGSFDCLILNDVDTSSLTSHQRAALETWVHQGGRLVIGGGAGARRTVSGLPTALLPVIPLGELEVDELPGLTDLGGGEPVRVPGPFLVSVGDLAKGRTLAEQDDLPLVRERTFGTGRADWVALDLATSPFDAWAGTASFWVRLILSDAAYPQYIPPDISPRQVRSSQMSNLLSIVPTPPAPSARGRLPILLGAYILLVGPVSYLVLRWRKALRWAWGTIPAVTLFFLGATFVLGHPPRNTGPILIKVAIVAPQANGRAHVDTYMGLLSPSQETSEITVTGDSLASALDARFHEPFPVRDLPEAEVVFVQGNPGRVRGLPTNQWSMQAFMVEDTWPDFGAVTGDLWFEDGVLVGTVHNGSRHALKDAIVALGNEFARLGDVAPGTEAQVELELSQLEGQLLGSPISDRLFGRQLDAAESDVARREIQIKQRLLDDALRADEFGLTSSTASLPGGRARGLMLLAWLDETPPLVQAERQAAVQHTTALLYAPLAYRLPQRGAISVPVGFVPGRMTEPPAEGGMCGAYGELAVYLGRGSAVFDFALPDDASDAQISQVTLSVHSEEEWWQPPKAALYDWRAGTWTELPMPVFGDNVLTDAGSLASRAGLVRVRLSAERDTRAGCFYVGLGFEGRR